MKTEADIDKSKERDWPWKREKLTDKQDAGRAAKAYKPMREIKFRAFIKSFDADSIDLSKSERIFPVILIDFESEIVGINFNDSTHYFHFEDIELIELMQYIGLKDNNGKEIYEGDIVICTRSRIFDSLPPTVWRGVIIFSKKESSYVILDEKTNGFYQIPYFKIEVIGNIYENKELLNERK